MKPINRESHSKKLFQAKSQVRSYWVKIKNFKIPTKDKKLFKLFISIKNKFQTKMISVEDQNLMLSKILNQNKVGI
jgi:hypothetical protein